jgi:hypothetical protein
MSKLLLKRYCSLCLLVLIALFPVLAAASSADMPAPFPQSELVSSTPVSSRGHLVLFSPVREVNNEIRSETMARLPVVGEGRLYEISRDSDRAKARDFYMNELQSAGARILYECKARDCGRSNVWANQIFGQRVLYGRDTTQDYFIAGMTADDGSHWLTLVYTVTRGNLREYIWVEHLHVEAGAAVPGLGSKDNRLLGPVIVPWQGTITYRFDWTASDRRQISDWAATEGAVVVLAGFSSLDAGETLEQAMARAGKATQSLSEVLAKTGVAREQQKLVVVGPSVRFTDPERQGDRVEITVVKR